MSSDDHRLQHTSLPRPKHYENTSAVYCHAHVRTAPQGLAQLVRPHGSLETLLELALAVHVDAPVLQLRDVDPVIVAREQQKPTEHLEFVFRSSIERKIARDVANASATTEANQAPRVLFRSSIERKITRDAAKPSHIYSSYRHYVQQKWVGVQPVNKNCPRRALGSKRFEKTVPKFHTSWQFIDSYSVI